MKTHRFAPKKTPISRLVLYKTLSEFKTLTGLMLLVRIA